MNLLNKSGKEQTGIRKPPRLSVDFREGSKNGKLKNSVKQVLKSHFPLESFTFSCEFGFGFFFFFLSF